MVRRPLLWSEPSVQPFSSIVLTHQIVLKGTNINPDRANRPATMKDQNMKNHISHAVKIAALLALPLSVTLTPAAGQIVYSTGFESPDFVAGAPLVGQNGWTAPPPLSPNAAVITTDKPRIGRQTVHVLGADLVHQDFINELTGGYYDAIGSYRHPVSFETGGTRAVRISANVRVDGPQTPTGTNFFSASVTGRALLTDDNGTAGIGQLDLSSDGHVYGWSGDAFVPAFQMSVPVTLGEWHNLAVVADFATSTYSFFVDDQYLGTFPFPPQDCGACFTTVLLRGSLLASAAPDTATLKKANYAAHYDNFMIQASTQ